MIAKEAINIILILFCFSLISCKVSDDGDNISHTTSWIGRKVEFPQELLLLNGTKFLPYKKLKNQLLKGETVVSIVDASCTSCILDHLNRTDSLFQHLRDEEDNVIFILNVKRNDSASFMVSIRPFIKAKGYILWDSNYYFERSNDVITSSIINRTFLLNTYGEIILIGNPLYQPDLMDVYRKALKDMK